MDGGIRDYYGDGRERERLGSWRWLEFARTKELLLRFLPPPPTRILDVGGGPGAYAAWLAGAGYKVHLVDPVPLHVEQALETAAAQPDAAFSAAIGDARELGHEDSSFDVVLLLGPLYHLIERTDRLKALLEAGRVCMPGGLVVAAAISRLALLFDGLAKKYLNSPEAERIVEGILREGWHPEGIGGRAEFSVISYFHHPDELRAEVADAELVVHGLFGIEGPGLWFAEPTPPAEDSEEHERMMWAARQVETELTLLGASAHLLAVAHKPDRPRGRTHTGRPF